ncbi:MAG: aminodeoxychorismate synthase component I, partial [Planctomycetes bacterium]|nr:aminodeoxychorismate synthase component I [Planctomycetota bacterium]
DSGCESNFTRRTYMDAVAAPREYILAGDIFEVNLSQRLSVPLETAPWELYARLRHHNPAPYAAFLSCGEAAVVSSSPELFLRVQKGRVITRPIKGTIASSPSPREDEEAVRTLAASEKDNAELAMIIDLERNDIGRVSKYGSVKVREQARLETFVGVHHLVSTIEGRLRGDVSLPDLLRATFPGGSITGAPKVRAMQIIDELEPCRRGVYTGSIGYVLPGGRAEFNIAIRTMVCCEGRVRLQVGGAVTADSDPAAEYEETLAKARGMMAALGFNVPPSHSRKQEAFEQCARRPITN